jgi:hypothetical protein
MGIGLRRRTVSGKRNIGKFVCYGDKEGGFCFGRIEDVCVINTQSGEQEAFILTNRITSSQGGVLINHSGRTILRASAIDEKDIYDEDMIKKGIGSLTDDELFLLAMMAKVEDLKIQSSSLPLGVINLFKTEGSNLSEVAKQKLKERLGIDA